jgi:outer membrane protein assembly factor BamB
MLNFCKSYGGAAVDGNVIYFPCVDGCAARVDDDGRLQVLWHVDDNDVSGSPVVAGGRVWVMDQSGGVLHALDPSTGRSTAQVQVGQTNRFASPSITGPDILVGTMSGSIGRARVLDPSPAGIAFNAGGDSARSSHVSAAPHGVGVSRS